MKRRTRAVLATVALAAVAGLSLLTGGASGAAGTTIKLGDNFFSPDKKKIGKGTKVRFKWIGQEKHNVVKKSGPGGSFASQTTAAPGVNYKKKFKKTGKYKILCTIHPNTMKLTLKVK